MKAPQYPDHLPGTGTPKSVYGCKVNGSNACHCNVVSPGEVQLVLPRSNPANPLGTN